MSRDRGSSPIATDPDHASDAIGQRLGNDPPKGQAQIMPDAFTNPHYARPAQHDLDAALIAFGLGRSSATDRADLACGSYIAMTVVGASKRDLEDLYDWAATHDGLRRMLELAEGQADDTAEHLRRHVQRRCDQTRTPLRVVTP